MSAAFDAVLEGYRRRLADEVTLMSELPREQFAARRDEFLLAERFLEMLVNPCFKVRVVLKSTRLRAKHLLRLMFHGVRVAQPVEQVFVRIGHHGSFVVR